LLLPPTLGGLLFSCPLEARLLYRSIVLGFALLGTNDEHEAAPPLLLLRGARTDGAEPVVLGAGEALAPPGGWLVLCQAGRACK
jgi:hypothetical protein